MGTSLLDLSGPASDGGFTFVYVDGWLTLTTPGDVNVDGRVNLFDLAIVRQHFGQTVGIVWTDGDLDGDGDVDRGDAAILARNYGRLPVAAAVGSAAAPEAAAAIRAIASRSPALAARRRTLSSRAVDAAMLDTIAADSQPADDVSVGRAVLRAGRGARAGAVAVGDNPSGRR